MRSENSSFNAWIRENLRRFIVMPIVFFVAMFLVGILPLILNYSRFDYVASSAYNLVCEDNFMIVWLELAFAISMSYSMFQYLHEVPSATAMHSMPISRTKLYWSSALSGAIMLAIPILLIGVLIPLFQGSYTAKGPVAEDTIYVAKNIFSIYNAAVWILRNLVYTLFVYAISNLAAVISGNRVVHVLMAMFLNILLIALDIVLHMLAGQFIFGLNTNIYSGFAPYYQPILYALNKRSNFIAETDGLQLYRYGSDVIIGLLIYLLIAIVISIVAVQVYKKVKLERIQDACFFPIVADVVSIFLTFFGASFMGLFLWTFSVSDLGQAQGQIKFTIIFIIWSVLLFLICRMISDGTVRVVHAKTWKKFGVYVAIMAVVLGITVFDAAGISNRVPESSEVATVTIEGNTLGMNSNAELKGESAEKVIALHKELLAYKEQTPSEADMIGSCDITYTLKNGKTLKRAYTLYYDKKNLEEHKAEMNALEELYNQEDFRAVLEFNATKLYSMDFYIDDESEGIRIKENNQKGFLAAFNKDVHEITFTDWLNAIEGRGKYYRVDVDTEDAYVSLYFNDNYKHTMKYLKDKGYK